MTRTNYTAQELFTLAYVSKKRKIYGVQDTFSQMSVSEREQAINGVCDSLLTDSTIDIDFDGNYSVNKTNTELIQFLCEPDMCIVIDVQRASNQSVQYIVWKRRSRTLQAEVINNRFEFFCENPEWIAKRCTGLLQGEDTIDKTVIPRIALQKASRCCAADNPDDAIRILRQNSASEELAALIVDSLYGKATCIRATKLSLRGEECKNRSVAFLSGRNTVLSIGETIVNLRTCAVFTGITAEAAEKEIESLLLGFVNC